MVRTYLNGAQASLEKSVLDDYGIVCALIHENAHLWSRAQWAVPIRLVVRDDQAEQAARILHGDAEAAAQLEEGLDATTVPPDTEQSELPSGNPWELLAAAFYFFLPAMCFLRMKYPAIPAMSQAADYEIAGVRVAHLIGWLAFAVATSLTVTYYYLRRSSFAKTGAEV